MLEPAESPRLQRARDAVASSAPFHVPSAASAHDAAPSPDRAAEPPLGDGYAAFRDRALASAPVSAALLATIAAQAAALALVWEAHARGVATLPPAVAAHVAAAVRAARPAAG